jgi:DNA-binding response OmpR family regulator
LVLADVHLDAGGDGVDTLLALRQHFAQDIPAIVVSGDVSQFTRDRVAGLGLPLLDKPVAPLRLRTLATRLLRAAKPSTAASSPAG